MDVFLLVLAIVTHGVVVATIGKAREETVRARAASPRATGRLDRDDRAYLSEGPPAVVRAAMSRLLDRELLRINPGARLVAAGESATVGHPIEQAVLDAAGTAGDPTVEEVRNAVLAGAEMHRLTLSLAGRGFLVGGNQWLFEAARRRIPQLRASAWWAAAVTAVTLGTIALNVAGDTWTPLRVVAALVAGVGALRGFLAADRYTLILRSKLTPGAVNALRAAVRDRRLPLPPGIPYSIGFPVMAGKRKNDRTPLLRVGGGRRLRGEYGLDAFDGLTSDGDREPPPQQPSGSSGGSWGIGAGP
ncbi:TIGR04222 domain-containing membrane protein [Nonomuraea sp. NPDC049758]|uniref:TIGR04222 domain-containing membrane protein n=1 Tax=Nonomuraea sp. NPDC049758 TaxID=3154360 RepID=UPI00342DB77E